MSGHSKWHQIKRKKGATDAKRAQEFTRLAAQIKQAARNGADPATNSALAEAIARAKRANMPQDNIDRLLSKSNSVSPETIFEAFGPGGTALLISVQTDNNRRTVAQLRKILEDHAGHLATPGSALWKFNKLGSRYLPKYPITVTDAAQDILNNLLQRLQNHPDIKSVITDAVE